MWYLQVPSWYGYDLATFRRPRRRFASSRRKDHRSVQQQVVHAIELLLAERETSEIKSDPDTLRALAEARAASRAGDVVYGTDAVHALVEGRRAS